MGLGLGKGISIRVRVIVSIRVRVRVRFMVWVWGKCPEREMSSGISNTRHVDKAFSYIRRPSCLELTARTYATNHINRTFQARAERIRDIPVKWAIQVYSFTYLLTYLLVLIC